VAEIVRRPTAPPPIASPAVAACPVCGRGFGTGISCQFCGQVDGLPSGVHLSSSARRLGGHLLELALLAVTALVGWLIWALIVFGRGQTPAKQVLGMRVVKLRTGQAASWGTMFLREFVCKTVIEGLAWFTFGLLNGWLIWDRKNQELWDKMVGTIVVDDPDGALAQRRPAIRVGETLATPTLEEQAAALRTRASAAEREEAAELLREHLVAGRLSVDELSARLDRVYRAGTRAELAEIFVDLPASKP
jgi:uncharacterized RDD family membrane protein YckC